MALGAVLGLMLIGLSVLICRFHLQPVEGVTVLAQLADASLGHNWAFYVIQFATVILLALSANTSFGGLPVLLKLLARDNYLPHVFALKADRQVHRHGVLALAVVSAALLVFSGGDTNTLVPLFAIGVFVGFTIAQVGMVRHWRQERGRGWRGKALLNGFGALLTGVSTVVVTASKFEEGAWLVVVTLPLLVAAFVAVHPPTPGSGSAWAWAVSPRVPPSRALAGDRPRVLPLPPDVRGADRGGLPGRRGARGHRLLPRPRGQGSVPRTGALLGGVGPRGAVGPADLRKPQPGPPHRRVRA
ncbi:hypothetical protein SALBM311S_10933 [Streptomyces alboniger]